MVIQKNKTHCYVNMYIFSHIRGDVVRMERSPFMIYSSAFQFHSLRWIHTIAFASVLKVTKMRPNVGENTFRGRKNLVHIVSVWSTALASVGER